MKKIKFLTLTALLLFQMSANCNERLFRIVHASPTDLLVALNSEHLPEAKDLHAASRLEKYFKISSKTVSDSEIKMTIEMVIRFLPENLAKFASFEIDLHKKERNSPNIFNIRIIFSPTMLVFGSFVVTPHQEGSLVEFEITRSTIPSWIIDRALVTIIKLNLDNRK